MSVCICMLTFAKDTHGHTQAHIAKDKLNLWVYKRIFGFQTALNVINYLRF